MEKNFSVYIMFGIPGSGKSTWIKNNLGEDVPVVSRDVIRATVGLSKSPDHKVVGNKEQEQLVTKVEYELIDMYSKSGLDFVIDDTNTSKFYRQQLISYLKEKGANIIAVKMNTPLDVCIKRRDGQINSDIMQKIYDRVNQITPDEYDELINVDYEDELQ